MNKTRKALKLGALYYLTESDEIFKMQFLESKFDDIMRRIFTNTNKTQNDLSTENIKTEKENAS